MEQHDVTGVALFDCQFESNQRTFKISISIIIRLVCKISDFLHICPQMVQTTAVALVSWLQKRESITLDFTQFIWILNTTKHGKFCFGNKANNPIICQKC